MAPGDRKDIPLSDMTLGQLFEGLFDPWLEPAAGETLRWPQLFEGATNSYGITRLKRIDVARTLGVNTRTIKNWELHRSFPDNDEIRQLIELLVSHHRPAWAPNSFRNWVERVDSVVQQRIAEARNRRTPVHRRPVARDALPILELSQLDQLPVRSDVMLKELWFGSGKAEVRVAVDRLVVLPTGKPLAHHFGPGMAHLAPKSATACTTLARERLLFVPRAFWVGFTTRDPSLQYRTLVYIDQPYGSHHDVISDGGYASQNLVCRGALAAFMDLRGQPYGPNVSEPLRGCGCAAVVVAIAYRHGKPVSRSESILVVRKGVLLPDDVFLAANGRPFESWPGNLSASRVLVQSRTALGGTSVYAMDLDGGHMVNLTEDEESVAWECVADDGGQDVAKWLGHGIVQVGKRTKPGGPIKLVKRRDPLWNALVNAPPPL